MMPLRTIPGDSSQRLSARLNLQFPYDWSNSQMSEVLLIDKIVEKYRFNDLMIISFYFGLPRVRECAKRLFGDELPGRLLDMLNNIESGFNDDQRAA